MITLVELGDSVTSLMERRIFKRAVSPIYRLYEWLLYNQIRRGPFPKHVAIIPDGNRRWARKEGLEVLYGHKFGYDKVKEVLEWLWNLNIEKVTLYAMSKENCIKRPDNERRNLFNLIEEGLNEIIHMREIDEKRVKVKVIGRLELSTRKIIELANLIEEKTKGYGPKTLTIAVCYGGRDEIVEAAKKIAQEVSEGRLSIDEISEEIFRKHLFTYDVEDPDLIIRTSGEERISNFLLWQSAYSELYFVESYWPEFRKIDLYRALRSYQKRKRNFGA